MPNYLSTNAKMRIENSFRTAFFLSVLLHFLVILVFNVKLNPSRWKERRKSEVFFYGSALAGSIGAAVEKKSPSVRVSDLSKTLSTFIKENFSPDSENGYHRAVSCLKLNKPEVKLQGYRKIIPRFAGRENTLKLPAVRERIAKEKNIGAYLEGLVFAKSPFSEMPFSENEESFNFKLRVFISRQGKIEYAEPLLFSGNPELDVMVKKTIKEWSFLPREALSGWYEITLNPESVSMAKASN